MVIQTIQDNNMETKFKSIKIGFAEKWDVSSECESLVE